MNIKGDRVMRSPFLFYLELMILTISCADCPLPKAGRGD